MSKNNQKNTAPTTGRTFNPIRVRDGKEAKAWVKIGNHTISIDGRIGQGELTLLQLCHSSAGRRALVKIGVTSWELNKAVKEAVAQYIKIPAHELKDKGMNGLYRAGVAREEARHDSGIQELTKLGGELGVLLNNKLQSDSDAFIDRIKSGTFGRTEPTSAGGAPGTPFSAPQGVDLEHLAGLILASSPSTEVRISARPSPLSMITGQQETVKTYTVWDIRERARMEGISVAGALKLMAKEVGNDPDGKGDLDGDFLGAMKPGAGSSALLPILGSYLGEDRHARRELFVEYPNHKGVFLKINPDAGDLLHLPAPILLPHTGIALKTTPITSDARMALFSSAFSDKATIRGVANPVAVAPMFVEAVIKTIARRTGYLQGDFRESFRALMMHNVIGTTPAAVFAGAAERFEKKARKAGKKIQL